MYDNTCLFTTPIWLNRVDFDGVYLNIMIQVIYPEYAIYVTCWYLPQKKIYERFWNKDYGITKHNYKKNIVFLVVNFSVVSYQ